MTLIMLPPGGTCGGPTAQSRTVGVCMKLTEMNFKEFMNLKDITKVEYIAEALKQKFIQEIKAFNEGERVQIVRRLPPPESTS